MSNETMQFHPGKDREAAESHCIAPEFRTATSAATAPVRRAGSSGLKVAFYYPWIYLTSGGERIIVELLRRSRHDWTLFTSHYNPDQTFPEIRQLPVVEVNRVSVKRDILSSAIATFRIMTLRLPLEDFDAWLVLGEGLGDMALFRNSAKPCVCYCLTPLRAAFDPVYMARSFEQRGKLGRLLLSVGLRIFRTVDRLAWKRYAARIYLSREALRRAVDGGLAGPGPYDIVYTGVGVRGDRPSDTFEPFFLIAGRIMWTKNIELGIRAFQEFISAFPEFSNYRLVIAGIVDEKSKPYSDILRELSAGWPQIEFRVAPSDADLCDLYRRCSLVLFTALNEDMGIVPIEAMAFGKPVISVNEGGPKETIEDGIQGLLVDPDSRLLAEAMAGLVRDPERLRRMGRAGFERAKLFSWDYFVDRIDDT
ncbi:MAG: glycosyltransferase, partial [Acidobacteria bacterium]|nr:glycosyltransferase [Acidobacteriota bacterium]